MEWKNFEELNIEYPDSIVEKRIKGFEKATSGLALLSLAKHEGFRATTTDVIGDFKFSLYLHSSYLKEYRFKVMSFGYNVVLNPIYVIIEDTIALEIMDNGYLFNKPLNIRDTKEFEELLTKIFSSVSFANVVGGVIKLSKKYLDELEDML